MNRATVVEPAGMIPARSSGSRACLICRTGERLVAVPLTAVVETMRPLPVVAFRGMPDFVQGVATIRGAVLPVVDVGILIGLSGPLGTQRPEAGARFVTIALDSQRGVALAVDSVIGVRSLDDLVLQDLPPLLESRDSRMLSAIGSLDAALLLLLDDTHLMPDSIWALLDEQVTTF